MFFMRFQMIKLKISPCRKRIEGNQFNSLIYNALNLKNIAIFTQEISFSAYVPNEY